MTNCFTKNLLFAQQIKIRLKDHLELTKS